MFRDRDGWRVQWTDADGKRRSVKFDSKGKAKYFEAELKAGHAKTPGATMTFAEYAARWLEEYCKQQKAESQWSTDESAIRVHMLPTLGDIRLCQLKPAMLEEWRRNVRTRKDKRTEKPLSPKTVNLVIALLRKMMFTAVKWGLLSESPAKGLDAYPLAEKAVRYWTMEERDRFLRFAKNLDPAFTELATVALFTGLRRGELAGLRRHQVDFDRGVIRVDAVHCFRSKHRIERTKNGKVGWVPMTAEVRHALRDRVHMNMEAPVFAPEVFHDALRKFHRLTQAAGCRQIRFHDMRHTFASCLVVQGVDLYRVQRLMRHETAAMTQRYAHLSIDDLKDAADQISGARRPARTSPDMTSNLMK